MQQEISVVRARLDDLKAIEGDIDTNIGHVKAGKEERTIEYGMLV